MTREKIIILIHTFFLLFACSKRIDISSYEINDEIFLYNQVGYEAFANKLVLAKALDSSFVITNEKGDILFESDASTPKYWPLSGDTVSILDLSSINKIGKYHILLGQKHLSPLIAIKDHPYSSLSKAAIKSYYYNRSAMELTTEYAGQWARPAGHPDTEVIIHPSVSIIEHNKGKTVNASGGWYDAGDYNKYIVNSAITTFTMMLSYELNSSYHDTLNLNIPESNDEIPDLINEILYNLNWMLTMQDTKDGGVHHKLTSKSFEDFVMPHQAVSPRYLMMKTTPATLDYVSTMAYASRIFKQLENGQVLSDKFLESAKSAWNWALLHPDLYYKQPKDISTGEYNDTCLVDEWFWAASEMYIATGNSECLEIITKNYKMPTTPKWDIVNSLGLISIMLSPCQEQFPSMKEDYFQLIDHFVTTSQTSPYHVSLSEFAWGSNSDVANHAMLKIVAHKIVPNKNYINSARDDLDYLLGRNATSYCFVSGYGDKSPMHIHHRPSSADNLTEPIPGFLVGGPNTIVPQDCGDTIIRSTYPAKSYIDIECSFSTNEIAINWNAPFVLLTTFFNAYDNNKNLR